MSIHGYLMRLFSKFRRENALIGNVKHFVFYLACDVAGDLGSIFVSLSYRSRPGMSISVWIFPPRLLATEIVGRGLYAPPPPSRGRARPLKRRLSERDVIMRLFWKMWNECHIWIQVSSTNNIVQKFSFYYILIPWYRLPKLSVFRRVTTGAGRFSPMVTSHDVTPRLPRMQFRWGLGQGSD